MVSLPTTESISGSRTKKNALIAGGSGVVVLLLLLTTTNFLGYLRIAFTSIDPKICPVSEVIAPASFYKDNSSALAILHDKKYRKQSVERLSGAVRIDTQIFDNQPLIEDSPETWAKFQKFHDFLEVSFPLVYANLEVKKVNTYGLVYIWKGINTALKPVLLAAHQDTVPVQNDTLADWEYPPFEGHYDGEYVYGRGVADCKNTLISILESLELLLEQKHKPSRTIIAAFGFDEEASGFNGASAIGRYLEKTFGKDSIYAVIDEGPGLTVDPLSQSLVAVPAVGEKGYLDIKVDLKTKGGHSSVPPDHTSIGIISELAYVIEQDPYSPVFTKKNPMLNYLQCMAVNDPKKKIGTLTKKAIIAAAHNKLANSKLIQSLSANPATKYLIQTSQALDVIRGGEKANALPEFSSLVVNHRIAVESSVDEVQEHFVSRVLEVAKRHNLGVTAFGKEIYSAKEGSVGTFDVQVNSLPLETAPRTPSDDTVWKYLSGVTRHVFEDLVYPDIKYPIITAPVIMPANTDTRHYWNLSKNIFRYTPANIDPYALNIHSVDEKLPFDAHLQTLIFFYEYLQAIDTAKADN